jgi:hypothetical protein
LPPISIEIPADSHPEVEALELGVRLNLAAMKAVTASWRLHRRPTRDTVERFSPCHHITSARRSTTNQATANINGEKRRYHFEEILPKLRFIFDACWIASPVSSTENLGSSG